MQKMILILTVFFLLAVPSLGLSESFTKEQVVRTARTEGAKVGYPETIVAIAQQETIAGSWGKHRYGIVGDKRSGFGGRSYGVMQVSLDAARDVLKKYPHLGIFPTDEHLLVALLTDDLFNIRVGAHYFKIQQDKYGNWKQAIIAYNGGNKNARKLRDPNDYSGKVWAKVSKQLQAKKKRNFLLAQAY